MKRLSYKEDARCLKVNGVSSVLKGKIDEQVRKDVPVECVTSSETHLFVTPLVQTVLASRPPGMPDIGSPGNIS